VLIRSGDLRWSYLFAYLLPDENSLAFKYGVANKKYLLSLYRSGFGDKVAGCVFRR
jgi:hypothetical protein